MELIKLYTESKVRLTLLDVKRDGITYTCLIPYAEKDLLKLPMEGMFIELTIEHDKPKYMEVVPISCAERSQGFEIVFSEVTRDMIVEVMDNIKVRLNPDSMVAFYKLVKNFEQGVGYWHDTLIQ